VHIPDGLITNPAIAIIMWTISLAFLVWSWKKAKATYTRSIASLLSISSAFVFAAQMINFPIAFGTSGHLIGGTFLAVLLGPYAAVLSMTIVLLMQALFFADGGILAFGANVFTMAIIGSFSYFIIKLLTRKSKSNGRFVTSVFIASWVSVMLAALVTALIIAPVFAGGIWVTLPSMLFFHAIIGLGEGAITTVLVSALQRLQPTVFGHLSYIREKTKI